MIAPKEPLTLRVGGARALKVTDTGFIVFDWFGNEMNVRASAVDTYCLKFLTNHDGIDVPAIEFSLRGGALTYAIHDPCIEDWNKFKYAVHSPFKLWSVKGL